MKPITHISDLIILDGWIFEYSLYNDYLNGEPEDDWFYTVIENIIDETNI